MVRCIADIRKMGLLTSICRIREDSSASICSALLSISHQPRYFVREHMIAKHCICLSVLHYDDSYRRAHRNSSFFRKRSSSSPQVCNPVGGRLPDDFRTLRSGSRPLGGREVDDFRTWEGPGNLRVGRSRSHSPGADGRKDAPPGDCWSNCNVVTCGGHVQASHGLPYVLHKPSTVVLR